MMVLPILTRDLRSVSRIARLHRDRVVAGAIAGALFIAFAGADRWWQGANVGQFLMAVPVSLIGPYFLLLLGLSLGAKLLSVERREGTLPLLLLTHLTGRDILIGKLLQAFVLEVNSLLAALPALVLPLVLAGFRWMEIGLAVIGCINVFFFGLALGLCAAVFFDEEKAMWCCLGLIFPFLAFATPLVLLLPSGPIRDGLALLQSWNPCEALGHVRTTAAGLSSGPLWQPLLTSHLVAWGLLTVGGLSLASASRRQASRVAGPRSRQRCKSSRSSTRSAELRRRLLDCNPFLWLASRHRGATLQAWVYFILTALFWGWLAWLTWALRGVNVTTIFMIAIAAGWLSLFVVVVPAEASRRLAEDRRTGILELLLCTPLSVDGIIRGQWLALRRRYLPVLTLAMVSSLVLMISGYLTFGFGGMLEPEDRSFWAFGWLAGIGLFPLCLTALCWVAMRRTLTGSNAGDASGLAIVQVLGLPCLAAPVLTMLSHALFRWDPEWWCRGALLVAGFALVQVVFAWRARAVLRRDLRGAAAQRYPDTTATINTKGR